MSYWGDNGGARVHSKEFEDNAKKIWSDKPDKKRREERILSDEQKKRQAMFPY